LVLAGVVVLLAVSIPRIKSGITWCWREFVLWRLRARRNR